MLSVSLLLSAALLGQGAQTPAAPVEVYGYEDLRPQVGMRGDPGFVRDLPRCRSTTILADREKPEGEDAPQIEYTDSEVVTGTIDPDTEVSEVVEQLRREGRVTPRRPGIHLEARTFPAVLVNGCPVYMPELPDTGAGVHRIEPQD